MGGMVLLHVEILLLDQEILQQVKNQKLYNTTNFVKRAEISCCCLGQVAAALYGGSSQLSACLLMPSRCKPFLKKIRFQCLTRENTKFPAYLPLKIMFIQI